MNKIEPTQADITAAQEIYETAPLFAMGRVKARSSHDLTQAFARHRLASEQLMEQMAEALERIIDSATMSFTTHAEMGQFCQRTARDALAAYRAKGKA